MSGRRFIDKHIRTTRIFHAAFLINCGAQLIGIEYKEDIDLYEMVLSLSLLDKRSAGQRLQLVVDDLCDPKRDRTLRDILNDSFFSSVESTYYRLRRKINDHYDDAEEES